MARLGLLLVPLLAIFAAVSGLYYSFNGARALARQEWGTGALLILLGLIGLALGLALWTVVRQLLRRRAG